eukprot:2048182-Pleurochrysis_carterae.AAC.1
MLPTWFLSVGALPPASRWCSVRRLPSRRCMADHGAALGGTRPQTRGPRWRCRQCHRQAGRPSAP